MTRKNLQSLSLPRRGVAVNGTERGRDEICARSQPNRTRDVDESISPNETV